MARIIPNQNTWVGFLTTVASASLIPTAAEITAGVDLTDNVVSVNASMRGNVVATPAFDNKFEVSIDGTVTGTFEADFYRDTVGSLDDAWTALPRQASGYFVISRFGGTGTPNNKPVTGNKVEVWPVRIVSRSMANMTNNTAQTFTVTAAINAVPNENATVT